MKKGFTMVELLASIVILGLLLVLTIPSYTSVMNNMKSSSLSGVVSEIEIAARKYGNSIKDEVKNSANSCVITNVDSLIQKGLLESDDKHSNVIYNPKDKTALNDNIYICYDTVEYKINTYYVFNFNSNKIYEKNMYVLDNDKLYECVIKYPGKGGIDGINKNNKKYFKLIKSF